MTRVSHFCSWIIIRCFPTDGRYVLNKSERDLASSTICYGGGHDFTQCCLGLDPLIHTLHHRPSPMNPCNPKEPYHESLVAPSDIHWTFHSTETMIDSSDSQASLSHQAERPFLCPACGKRFSRKGSLMVHQRIHTGERPFSCSKCGKCFTQQSVLHRHQVIHTGERPFSCFECGKSFTRKRTLVGHQKIHTHNGPFLC